MQTLFAPQSSSVVHFEEQYPSGVGIFPLELKSISVKQTGVVPSMQLAVEVQGPPIGLARALRSGAGRRSPTARSIGALAVPPHAISATLSPAHADSRMRSP